MNILLHLCCGPCTAFPLDLLRSEGLSVKGYFYNPNIHPFREFKMRIQAVEDLAARVDLEVDYVREYGLTEYLRKVVFNERDRCAICYEMRLVATARAALERGAEAFSSTLLYSRYQKHHLIREIAEKVSRRLDIPFYYRDFRKGWQQGIDMSLEMGLYRQSYCGCIYSEQERYDKSLRKKAVSVKKN